MRPWEAENILLSAVSGVNYKYNQIFKWKLVMIHIIHFVTYTIMVSAYITGVYN